MTPRADVASREQDHLLVEFVGLPASGKTHLASEVKRHLVDTVGASGITISTASEQRCTSRLPVTGFRVLGGVLLRPLQSATALRSLYRTRQHGIRRLVRYWLYQLYVDSEWRHATSPGELHLSDQGFLQHIWRVRLTALEMAASDVRQFIDRHAPVSIPDVVVFVDVDHRTRMQRGVQRGTSVDPAFFDPDHPEIERDRAAYEDVKTAVRAVAHDRCGCPKVLQIENTDEDLSENVAYIANEIASAWPSDTPLADMA